MKRLYLFLFLIIIATVGYGQFTDINAILPGVYAGKSAWGDYDNDGDMDILMTGYTGNICISKVYRNDGNGMFTDIQAELIGVLSSSIAWGDYDNDNFLDILLSGSSVNNIGISKVYHNNGNGTFTDINCGLLGLFLGSCSWGDYDNDGDLDILMTGTPLAPYIPTTKIYRNDRNNTFTDIGSNITGVDFSSAAWGDYDNDGDLDILLTGSSVNNTSITKIYRNDNNGIFTDIVFLIGVNYSSVAWGDYDNDGDLDILLTGYSPSMSKIYRNDGNGIFTDINAGLIGVMNGSAAWGDVDNDGDLDIMLTGSSINFSTYVSKIYRNDGNGLFSDINAGLTGVWSSSACWGDFDGDGDLDILLTGDGGSGIYTKIYRNEGTNTNIAPSAPINLSTSIVGNYVIFQWNASIDSQTPSLGINYILRIGTTPSGCQILSPMSSQSGLRMLPSIGYTNSNCSWKILRSVLPEHYYWSVQAIDGAFSGSAFAIGYPEITISTTQSIQFGNVPVNDLPIWSEVQIQNTGLANLNISNLHFYSTPSQFQYSYANLGIAIPPGEIDTILVRFAPTTVGAVNDTLYIVSNAVNTPVLKIRLSGTGTYVPPAVPQNIHVVMQGYNAVVSWDAVTTDIHGNAITPDCYIVLYNETPFEDAQFYYYLCYTDQLSYSHIGVGRFRPQMYYQVIAYKDYGRGYLSRLTDLNGTYRKIKYKDLMIN